jgi:hypothetical protein
MADFGHDPVLPEVDQERPDTAEFEVRHPVIISFSPTSCPTSKMISPPPRHSGVSVRVARVRCAGQGRAASGLRSHLWLIYLVSESIWNRFDALLGFGISFRTAERLAPRVLGSWRATALPSGAALIDLGRHPVIISFSPTSTSIWARTGGLCLRSHLWLIYLVCPTSKMISPLPRPSGVSVRVARVRCTAEVRSGDGRVTEPAIASTCSRLIGLCLRSHLWLIYLVCPTSKMISPPPRHSGVSVRVARVSDRVGDRFDVFATQSRWFLGGSSR